MNLDDSVQGNNKIRQHEDNIKFLNSQLNCLTKSIANLQGMFRICHSLLSKLLQLRIFHELLSDIFLLLV